MLNPGLETLIRLTRGKLLIRELTGVPLGVGPQVERTLLLSSAETSHSWDPQQQPLVARRRVASRRQLDPDVSQHQQELELSTESDGATSAVTFV